MSGEPDLRFPLNLLLARRAAGNRSLKFMIPSIPKEMAKKTAEASNTKVASGRLLKCLDSDERRIRKRVPPNLPKIISSHNESSRSATSRCSAVYNILVMVMRGSKHDRGRAECRRVKRRVGTCLHESVAEGRAGSHSFARQSRPSPDSPSHNKESNSPG